MLTLLTGLSLEVAGLSAVLGPAIPPERSFPAPYNHGVRSGSYWADLVHLIIPKPISMSKIELHLDWPGLSHLITSKAITMPEMEIHLLIN